MPTAHADFVTTGPMTPVTIDVLENDAGDGLAVVSFTNPANGSLVFNADQSFTYIPHADFLGTDEFSYTINDSSGGSAAAMVTIAVQGEDSPPVAHDDLVTITQGQAIDIPALANDNDPEGGALRLAGFTAPGHGVVMPGPDGTLRYISSSTFVGTDSFSYTIVDEAGQFATAHVTVKVAGANATPIVRPDEVNTSVNTAIVIDLLANDEDPDGDPMTLAALTMPEHGRIALNDNQLVTYTPAIDYVGADSFGYTVRDSHGNRASGEVRIDVREVNYPPVANDDSVAVEADGSAVIDILANDNDPDGDPLNLVALNLPTHGQLALNSDKSLTYTPIGGYIGDDGFSYTLSDGRGGFASAEVEISVEPSSNPDLFANGYRYRHKLVVPPHAVAAGEVIDGFVMRVEETGTWLRAVEDGGEVSSPTGDDLRFELADGTKLPHELVAYDAATGSMSAWVRLPTLRGGESLELQLYAGKPGLTESEADPAACWQDYLAVWDVASGVDRSGRGRDLVPSNVTGATLKGGAGLFDGTAIATTADASWLEDLSEVSLQTWIQADPAILSSDRGILSQGDITGSDSDHGINLRFDVDGFQGGGRNAILWQLDTTDEAGSTRVESASDLQSAEPMLLAASWQSGGLPRLFVQGKETTPSNAPQARIGTIKVHPGGFALGASAKDSATGGWQGLIGEVRVADRPLAASRAAAEYRNQEAPRAFYGFGGGETPTGEGSALIAMPLEGETTSGAWVDFDVLGAATLPEGDEPVEIAIASQPQGGLATVIDGKLRYTPQAGFAGRERFGYLLTCNGRESLGLITVEVTSASGSAGGDSGGGDSGSDSAGGDELPDPVRTINVSNGNALQNALSNAKPGDHIVLASGTYTRSGDFKLSASGNAGAPIVIKAATPLEAKVAQKLILNGNHNVAQGLALVGKPINVGGNGSRVTRCKVSGTDSYAILVTSGDGVRVDHCDVQSNERGIGLSLDPGRSDNPVNTRIDHNYLHDFGGGKQGDNTHEPLQIGQTKTHTDIEVGAIVEYNLLERVSIDTECISVKSSGNTIRFNTVLDSEANITNRHGERNSYIGNWLENSRGFMIHDRDIRLIGNRLINSGSFGLRIMGGNIRPGSWPGAGTHPAAEDTLLIGNNADRTTIGHTFSGHNVPCRNVRIEAHVGPLSYGTHTGTTTASSTSETVPTALRLSRSDVGPEAD